MNACVHLGGVGGGDGLRFVTLNCDVMQPEKQADAKAPNISTPLREKFIGVSTNTEWCKYTPKAQLENTPYCCHKHQGSDIVFNNKDNEKNMMQLTVKWGVII